MRTPDSYSFGEVLKSALDKPFAPPTKTPAQKDIGRLHRSLDRIADSVEEFERYLENDRFNEAVREAEYVASDLESAAKRLGNLPTDGVKSVSLLLNESAETVRIVAETARHMLSKGNHDYVREKFEDLPGLVSSAFQALDRILFQASQELS